jgi:hypothetical protein
MLNAEALCLLFQERRVLADAEARRVRRLRASLLSSEHRAMRH